MCVHELQGWMTTLMRNGRDRRSENPQLGQAILERVLVVGTDQRITSGPAATAAASHGGKPPSENRPYTWLHPNASQKVRFFSLAPRAPSIHGPQGCMAQCRPTRRLTEGFRPPATTTRYREV
jgi:hypothetical protein